MPDAQADPLVPLTSAENAFLDHAHRVLAASGDPAAFKSDGELLDDGWYACNQRAFPGNVGYNLTYISPVLTQLAFIDLCHR